MGKIGDDLFGFPWINLLEVIFITPVVAAVFYNGKRFSKLTSKIFNFLGETSFSLYLTHWLVIAITTNALLAACPSFRSAPGLFWLVLTAVVLAITIPVSWASHKWIELSGMRIGKAFANRIPSSESVHSITPLLRA
jgi:peptidoglycan/LPS O-acetylase OafA/YrhL